MSDAATDARSDGAATPVRVSQVNDYSVRLVYAIYRWYVKDRNTGGRLGNKKIALKVAGEIDKNSGRVRTEQSLKRSLPEFLRLIGANDERAWLRLLLWTRDRVNHMFSVLKTVSPFEGKKLCYLSFDGSKEHEILKPRRPGELPSVEHLWPIRGDADPLIPGHFVFVFPVGVDVSVHCVKRKGSIF